jgi:hypothetical protein
MREVTTKTLDFLELFKINPLFKDGVNRLSHPSLIMLDFETPSEISGKEKLFLDSVCNRFYTKDYDLLFGKNNLDDYDRKNSALMFYLLKNMIPYLHFFEVFGVQPAIKDPQLIFNMRAHYINNEEINEINEMNFTIDKIMVKQPEEKIYYYYKKLSPKIKKSQYLGNMMVGYDEFMDTKYPDELKMFLIDMINSVNSYFFEYLYENIEGKEYNVFGGLDTIESEPKNSAIDPIAHINIIFKHNIADIAKTTKRGYGNVFIISEKLIDTISEEPEFEKFFSSFGLKLNDFYDSIDKTFRFTCLNDNRGNRWIIDSCSEEKTIIIGYKGTSEMDAGLFFVPMVGDFNISISDDDRLLYYFPKTIVENSFGCKQHFRKIIIK